MRCFFGKLGQMSNFGRLKSANEHILDRIFPDLRQIPKNPFYGYGGYYLEAPFPRKRFALHCSAFSVNWCKCPLLIGNIHQMSTFWIDYFQMCGKSLKSIWRIRWALNRSSIISKKMRCFFGKLGQMSYFGRLKSAK